MDSNRRYPVEDNFMWDAPSITRNSPSPPKPALAPGTDGSNPSPSSGESSANPLGAGPVMVQRYRVRWWQSPAPSSARRQIVSRCVPVIRSVLRIELPSTKQLMI